MQGERGDADAPRRRRHRRCAGAARGARRAGRAQGRTARSRQWHAGDRRRRPARPFGGEQQVDAPRGVAYGDDMRRIDVDLLEAHQALERAQLVDLHLDVADLQQVVGRRVDDFDSGRADDARDLERQLGALLEGDDDVGVQRRRAQLRRQAARQVAEVGRDREAVELDAQLAVAALGERRRRAGRIEAAAVEREGEVRLDLDLALRRQRADEGDRQLQVADAMRRRERPVDEVGSAAGEDDVVDGEARRLGGRRQRAARRSSTSSTS